MPQNWWESDPTSLNGVASAPPQSAAAGNWWDKDPTSLGSTPGLPAARMQSSPNLIKDFALSAAQGVPEGLAAMTPLGFGMNMLKLGGVGGEYLAKKLMGDNLPPSFSVPGANPLPSNILPSSHDVVQGLQEAGGLPYHNPETTLGRFSKTATEFATGGPVMATAKGAQFAERVAMGGLGLVSEGAGELTKGTPFEVPARIAAPIIAGKGGQMALDAAQTTAAGAGFIPGMAGLSEAAAGRVAAKDVIKGAQDPVAVRTTARNYTESAPDLPQTMGEISTDSGIVSLQNRMIQEGAKGRNPILDQAALDRGAAQRAVIDKTVPSADTNIGGFITNLFEKRRDDLARQADRLTATDTPEELGKAMRESLQKPAATAKQAASDLYETALKPYDDVAVSLDPIKKKAFELNAEVTKNANVSGRAFTPAEQEHMDRISSWKWKQQGTIGSLRELDSELYATRKALENDPKFGQGSVPVARINDLRNQVKQTIEKAYNDVHTKEQSAVTTGTISPDDTLVQKLNEAFARTKEAGYGKEALTTGRPSGVGATQVPESGAPLVVGAGNTERAPSGGSGPAAGAKGSPAAQVGGENDNYETVVENGVTKFRPRQEKELTPYQKANKQYAEYKQTYSQGPVGDVLKQIMGAPKVANSDVGAKFFNQTNKSKESIDAYLKAGGSPEKLRDYMMYDLRRHAINDKGVINLTRFNNWVNSAQTRGTLQAFPEMRKVLDDITASVETKTQALHEVEKTKLAGFMNDADPTKAFNGLMRSRNPNMELNNLYTQVRKDPEALAGARRLLVEHIMARAESDLADPKKMQTFLDQNKKGIISLVGGQTYNNFIRVLNNSRAAEAAGLTGTGYAAAVKGLSPQDVKAASGAAAKQLGRHVAGKAGAAPAFDVVAGVLNSIGVHKARDLKLEMMLNPKLAHEMFQKVPDYIPVRMQQRILNSLRASAPSIYEADE